MGSLADLPTLIGFFSYSRNDDEGDDGAITALANRIYRELRAQLGRNDQDFKLWRDKDALATGERWKEKLKEAVSESVFFIQMVSPSTLNSPFCRFEFDSFVERERELGRNDLVFPILYISVPQLEEREETDGVISIAKERQYVDWRRIRHRNKDATEVKEAVEEFCKDVVRALRRQWLSPEQRRTIEEQRRAEEQHRLQEAEAKRRVEEEERRRIEEQRRAEEQRRLQEAARKETEQAELKRREKEERGQRKQELRELLLSRVAAIWSGLWSPKNQTAVTAITAPSANHIAIQDKSPTYLLTVIGLAAFAIGMLAEFLQRSGHYFLHSAVHGTHGLYAIISEKAILFSIVICSLLYAFGRISIIVLLISFVVINAGRVIGAVISDPLTSPNANLIVSDLWLGTFYAAVYFYCSIVSPELRSWKATLLAYAIGLICSLGLDVFDRYELTPLKYLVGGGLFTGMALLISAGYLRKRSNAVTEA
jgi:hypothetical protein